MVAIHPVWGHVLVSFAMQTLQSDRLGNAWNDEHKNFETFGAARIDKHKSSERLGEARNDEHKNFRKLGTAQNDEHINSKSLVEARSDEHRNFERLRAARDSWRHGRATG